MRTFSKFQKQSKKIVSVIAITAVALLTGFAIHVTARTDAPQAAAVSGNTIQDTTAQNPADQKEPAQMQLYAHAAVLMDADSGRVLYGKNETEILPMASTTKIMTCILALEYGNPDDIVEVSSYAASMPKVKLYMKPG